MRERENERWRKITKRFDRNTYNIQATGIGKVDGERGFEWDEQKRSRREAEVDLWIHRSREIGKVERGKVMETEGADNN